MSDLTPRDVFNTVFASYIIGDHRTAIELTHPEAEYRFPGDPALIPWAGTYVGPGIKRWFDCMKDNLDLFHSKVSRVYVAGDSVLFEAEELWRVRATGRRFRCAIAGVCTVDRGRVAAYREYADTAPIAVAFRP